MKKDLTTWTVTSPTGQVLTGSEDPSGVVCLASDAGNHGSVDVKVWDDKLAQMIAMGYTYTAKTNTYNI